MSIQKGRNMCFKNGSISDTKKEAIKYSGVIIFQEAVEITSSNLSVSFFTFSVILSITIVNQVTFFRFLLCQLPKKCDPISENAI